MKSKSFKSSFSQMALVPIDIYNKLMKLIDNESEKKKLLNINEQEEFPTHSTLDNQTNQTNHTNQTNQTNQTNVDNEAVTLNDVYNKVNDIDTTLKNSDEEVITQTEPINSNDMNTQTEPNEQNDASTQTYSKQTKDANTQTEQDTKEINTQTDSTYPKDVQTDFRETKSISNPKDVQTDFRETKSISKTPKEEKVTKYKCNICRKVYTRKWVLKRHKQTMHNNKKEGGISKDSTDTVMENSSDTVMENMESKNINRKRKGTYPTIAKQRKQSAIKRKIDLLQNDEKYTKKIKYSQGQKRSHEGGSSQKKKRFASWIPNDD